MKRQQQIIKVVLNSDRAEDRKILDYFPYAGMSMSKVFKTAMLQFIDRQNGEFSNEPLLRAVRQAIREELKSAQIQTSGEQSQQATRQIEDEEDVDPLAFLDELDKLASF